MDVKKDEFGDLNDKQKMFCELYILNGNASKSATLAGYSEKTASAAGSRMLKLSKISKYINFLRKEQAMKLDIDAIQTVKYVSDLANPANGASHATQLKALEMLMKYFGLLVEKKEVKTDANVNVLNPSALSDEELNKLLKEYEKDNGSFIINADFTELE